MTWGEHKRGVLADALPGWEAAMLEFEHQAEHWDTPDHRETGHLIASALRAAVDIARSGGLQCEHRPCSPPNDGLDAADSATRDEETATVTNTAGGLRHRDAA
jgi:hypothetical protein